MLCYISFPRDATLSDRPRTFANHKHLTRQSIDCVATLMNVMLGKLWTGLVILKHLVLRSNRSQIAIRSRKLASVLHLLYAALTEAAYSTGMFERQAKVVQ